MPGSGACIIFVDEKIVKLGNFTAVGALHFYLAAKMVVGRKWFGPDYAEMMFAIRTYIHLVSFHWNSCIVDLCR